MAESGGVTPIRSHSLREHEQHWECSGKKTSKSNTISSGVVPERKWRGARDTNAPFLRANQCLRWLIFFHLVRNVDKITLGDLGNVFSNAPTSQLGDVCRKLLLKKVSAVRNWRRMKIRLCKTLNGGLLHLATAFRWAATQALRPISK